MYKIVQYVSIFLAIFVSTVILIQNSSAKNLLPDGSFEHVENKDQFGRVFPEWLGWIYERNSWFEASTLATDGKFSCLMRADQNGKIRINSIKLDLTPGRYEISFDLRGLDIATHVWNRPIDFSMGFDNQFFPIRKVGNFDWTRIRHVFEIPAGPPTKAQVLVGLLGTGWLWVDNVRLIAVPPNTPLTTEPEWMSQPAAIAQKNLGSNSVRCPLCGFRNALEATHCYGCGTAFQAAEHKQKDTPEERLIADFERGANSFAGGKVDTEKAISGEASLKLEKGWASLQQALDFSTHDDLLFDVYNPQQRSIPLLVEIRDTQSKGYWDRVNYTASAPPGRTTVYIPTQLYVGEKSRPGRVLNSSKVTFFSIGVGEAGPIYIDDIRLKRSSLRGRNFDQVLAFDFGPLGSPVMVNTLPVHNGMEYHDGRDYGFSGATFWRSHNVLQPDPLLQDFLCPESGSFKIRLPDGLYTVLLKIDSPGGYWGEVQRFKKRTITMNGKTVIQEEHDFPSFLSWYYHNAETEDLPGVRPFQTYIESRIPWRKYQVKVNNGMLDIGFLGKDLAISLSALVVYPESKKAEGEMFVNLLDQRREYIFSHTFVESQNKPRGITPNGLEYVLFQPPLGDLPGPKDGPRKEELLRPDISLKIIAAKGETGYLPIAVQLGNQQKLADFELRIGTLTDPNNRILPQEVFHQGWLDFRIQRESMDGAIWAIRPRYYHRGASSVPPGLTRTFLLEYNIPKDALPGTYTGMVQVLRNGIQATAIPVSLEILPFSLEPIEDVAVGPWGPRIDIPWYGDDQSANDLNWKLFQESLKAIKASGASSFSGIPSIKVKASKSNISIDFSRADREMTYARSLGFSQMVSSYGLPDSILGYKLKGYAAGPDNIATKQAGFPDGETYIRELYSQIDKHAVAHDWLKVAWNIADEPHADIINGAIQNAQVHRSIGEKLQRTTFMGATSLTSSDKNEGKEALIRALPMAMLNLHDKAAIDLIQKASNEFGFYNGSDRWTMGQYMKMLVSKYKMKLRLVWHFNVAAGNPYYALDCREDDYCWYNSNKKGELVPSVQFITEILPGLNDYRYLSTLEKKITENQYHPRKEEALAVWKKQMEIEPAAARDENQKRKDNGTLYLYDQERLEVINAILKLLPQP